MYIDILENYSYLCTYVRYEVVLAEPKLWSCCCYMAICCAHQVSDNGVNVPALRVDLDDLCALLLQCFPTLPPFGG